MKFLIFQTFYSADESQRGLFVAAAENNEALLLKWQELNCIDNNSNSVETSDGNRIELDDILEISQIEFEVLTKYIEKL